VLEPMKKVMPTEAYDEINEMLGVKLHWNDQLLSSQFSWTYLVGFTVVLIGLVLWRNWK